MYVRALEDPNVYLFQTKCVPINRQYLLDKNSLWLILWSTNKDLEKKLLEWPKQTFGSSNILHLQKQLDSRKNPEKYIPRQTIIFILFFSLLFLNCIFF